MFPPRLLSCRLAPEELGRSARDVLARDASALVTGAGRHAVGRVAVHRHEERRDAGVEGVLLQAGLVDIGLAGEEDLADDQAELIAKRLALVDRDDRDVRVALLRRAEGVDLAGVAIDERAQLGAAVVGRRQLLLVEDVVLHGGGEHRSGGRSGEQSADLHVV